MDITGGPSSTPDGILDSHKIGYGMSRRLLTPGTRVRYHHPVVTGVTNSPAGISGPASAADLTDPGYKAPFWKVTMLTRPAKRILFGDSRNAYIDPQPSGWEYAMTTSQSGDPSRHGGKLINDPSATTPAQLTALKSRSEYKTQRANYVFCDGHAETLDPDTALAAINNP